MTENYAGGSFSSYHKMKTSKCSTSKVIKSLVTSVSKEEYKTYTNLTKKVKRQMQILANYENY